ncbi:hypothetical protein Pyn_21782 [Prunus yedoensis var. nudiflora]|uniref:Uncharacterized protein n=1 Tax=Prunus yedoensis var. nudiflora TaxID=2094558 RepID=A0A314YK55_PRUYE|nr:hypothetical protein Pyn_21782 [Prunus yedoensis var. nudiflora]
MTSGRDLSTSSVHDDLLTPLLEGGPGDGGWTGARFMRRDGSAVRRGLVIDVDGLHPFDLPKAARRLRPREWFFRFLCCVV